MAQQHGIQWMIASGRRPFSIQKVIDGLGGVIPDLCICCNGGVIFDNNAQKVLLSENFSKNSAITAIKALEGAIPGAGYAIEVVEANGTRFLCDQIWLQVRREYMYYPFEEFPDALSICEALKLREPTPDAIHFVDGKKLRDDDIGGTKLLVVHPEFNSDELFQKVPAILKHRDSPVNVSYSNSFQLEISARDVSKGSILERFCDEKGIHRREVCAFGDFLNDIEMLRWVGIGVVMKNGADLAKKEALYHTESNDEDGVALFIEKLLHQTRSQRSLKDRRGTM